MNDRTTNVAFIVIDGAKFPAGWSTLLDASPAEVERWVEFVGTAAIAEAGGASVFVGTAEYAGGRVTLNPMHLRRYRVTIESAPRIVVR